MYPIAKQNIRIIHKCCPHRRANVQYSGAHSTRRRHELGVEGNAGHVVPHMAPRFHVLLTTAERITNADSRRLLVKHTWSAVVIDEGHRLKGEHSLLACQLRKLKVCLLKGP